jgi:cytochrome c-type biogenesis protein CcmH
MDKWSHPQSACGASPGGARPAAPSRPASAWAGRAMAASRGHAACKARPWPGPAGSTAAAWLGTTLACLMLVFMVATSTAFAKEAQPAADDPVLEARMLRVAAELRCLVCQNQTIADSHSGLAEDLRREVREQLKRGASDEQVVQYMTDRYGDFVRYRPPFKGTTLLLWAGPIVLLLAGIAVLVLVLRRRARMAPEMFEPDEGDVVDDERAGSRGTPR